MERLDFALEHSYYRNSSKLRKGEFIDESILTLNQKYQERYIKERYELFREEILPTNSNLITYVNEEKII